MNARLWFARGLVEPLGYRVVPVAALERIEETLRSSLTYADRVEQSMTRIDGLAQDLQRMLKPLRGAATPTEPQR